MSKYRELEKYLLNKGEDRVKLTFEEIQYIISDNLPKSAYKYRQWWENSISHTQADAWLNAGYKVEEVKFNEYIIFKSYL